MLISVTEIHTKETVDELVATIEDIVRKGGVAK